MVFIQILDNFSLAYMKISELAESGYKGGKTKCDKLSYST